MVVVVVATCASVAVASYFAVGKGFTVGRVRLGRSSLGERLIEACVGEEAVGVHAIIIAVESAAPVRSPSVIALKRVL